jgi:hypothetical protein
MLQETQPDDFSTSYWYKNCTIPAGLGQALTVFLTRFASRSQDIDLSTHPSSYVKQRGYFPLLDLFPTAT